MIEFKGMLLSDDLFDKQFVCDIEKCKGACCVEGDLGAPLDKDELKIFDAIYDKVEPYLSETGKKVIEEQGKYILDWENDYSTPTINDKECAYAVYDADGGLACAIEQAYNDGEIPYRKPISCHLYPIRISKVGEYTALNYDKWEICKAACVLGEKLKVNVFDFLKEPLVRQFGEEWYAEVEELKKAYINSKSAS